ncbi:MAG: hypothetical protein ACRDLN_03815 [Solirubrobacteraceae bacterium]
MNTRAHAIGFGISLRDPPHIDTLADEISAALGVVLAPSQERGLVGDYVGEMAGLSLWLRVTEPEFGPPERTVLVGEPEYPPESEDDWIDIGAYIAQVLRDRTGRSWESRGHSSG